MLKTRNIISANYLNQVKAQEQVIADLKNALNRIAFLRLGLFVLEILVVALMINVGYSIFIALLLVVPIVLFALLVKRQSLTQEKLSYAEQLLWVYQNELDYLERSINGYDDGQSYQDESHHYASDLDIFGPASLFSSINRCKTAKGMDILAQSLGRSRSVDLILMRQEAIAELEERMPETIEFRAQLQNHDPAVLQAIEYKLEHQLPQQLRFTRHSWLRYYSLLIPFISVAVLVLAIAVGGWAWRALAILALSNAALTFFLMKDINKVYYGFSGGSALLNSFADTIRWTESISWKSSYIRNFFNEVGETSLSLQIKNLASIIQAFDARLNIIMSSVLNLLFLWDIRCCLKLQNWHQRSSDHLLKGLYRISQFEELISFATLQHNHPDWNFPVLKTSFYFSGTDIGHPLIPQARRVANDYFLEELPMVDIVTGSNMAGKSTFLRTIGINMVLAYAGAPVCAGSMSVSVFNLLTYMRIKDSLNDQTSTFKAELNRLRMILDAVSSQPDSLVLIDEMLRGTNSKDKYQGSKVFIERLIAKQIPALFATHDLQLSEMQAEYPRQVRNYHFDIQFSEGEMDFDYRIKTGPCQTFNAALLLKEIGLSL